MSVMGTKIIKTADKMISLNLNLKHEIKGPRQ